MSVLSFLCCFSYIAHFVIQAPELRAEIQRTLLVVKREHYCCWQEWEFNKCTGWECVWFLVSLVLFIIIQLKSSGRFAKFRTRKYGSNFNCLPYKLIVFIHFHPEGVDTSLPSAFFMILLVMPRTQPCKRFQAWSMRHGYVYFVIVIPDPGEEAFRFSSQKQ
jgi:hypothetical protein